MATAKLALPNQLGEKAKKDVQATLSSVTTALRLRYRWPSRKQQK